MCPGKYALKACLAIFLMVFAAAVLLTANSYIFAQETNIDINNLVQETQKRSDNSSEMSFVWWIPEQFWQASFARSPNTTPAQVEEFLKALRPYTLIAAVDGKVGSYGSVAYKTEADIRTSIKLVDAAGNTYTPYSEDGVNPDAKGLLSVMKPMIVNLLGPIGQNMYFFLFPAISKDGNAIADARKEGGFSVKLGEKDFKWTLPLGSLIPSKTCPVCKQKFNGSYKFCPFDGTKLE